MIGYFLFGSAWRDPKLGHHKPEWALSWRNIIKKQIVEIWSVMLIYDIEIAIFEKLFGRLVGFFINDLSFFFFFVFLIILFKTKLEPCHWSQFYSWTYKPANSALHILLVWHLKKKFVKNSSHGRKKNIDSFLFILFHRKNDWFIINIVHLVLNIFCGFNSVLS